MDFNTGAITESEFEQLLKKTGTALKKAGIEAKIKFSHWDNIHVSKFIFPEVERAYSVVSKYSKKEGITIKVKTNNLKHKIKTETQVISGFGEFFPCICTDKGVLFADKIDALCNKNRARDIYDIIFMLSNKYPVDKNALKLLGIKIAPAKAIYDAIKNIPQAEFEKQAEILRPFFFEESEADLILNAQKIIPALLEKYDK